MRATRASASSKASAFWARIAPLAPVTPTVTICPWACGIFVRVDSVCQPLFWMSTDKRPSQPVDAGAHASGTEAVVDVDDGHIRRATVEHAEQRRHAAETGAITCAGGHRNRRHAHQAADDARKRSFHSGHAKDQPGLG